MKLVDILARELKVWPDNSWAAVGQSNAGSLHEVHPPVDRLRWTDEHYSMASDWARAEVTRAQWQAAVDALKAESSPAWVGIGLPPIGTDVEVFAAYSHPRFDRLIGKQVHIVAHDVINGDPVAVFRMPVDGDDTEQDYHAMVAGSFRPIRTPEQIAAEEREQAINAMINTLGHPTAILMRDSILGALYDAGYRKFEKLDN